MKSSKENNSIESIHERLVLCPVMEFNGDVLHLLFSKCFCEMEDVNLSFSKCGVRAN